VRVHARFSQDVNRRCKIASGNFVQTKAKHLNQKPARSVSPPDEFSFDSLLDNASVKKMVWQYGWETELLEAKIRFFGNRSAEAPAFWVESQSAALMPRLIASREASYHIQHCFDAMTDV